MDVLAGRTSSTSPPVTVSAVRAELRAASAQAEYWRETLADAPEPLELPADRPRPAQPDHAGALVRLELDEEVTAALRALGSRHGAHAVHDAAGGLGRGAGPAVGADGPGDRHLLGSASPLPVRVDLSGSPTAAELLGRVEARVQGALRNGDLPFERVVELVQPDGADASATPLFRAAFAWRDAPVSGPEPRSTAGLDLSLELREEGGGIAGEVVFATALFDRETVERYAGYLRRVLAGMAADETRPVDRLALLSDEERRLVTEEWNRTEAPYPADSYIHEQFEAQAGRTPDAVAVVYEDRQLTYGELNARANRLAHHLRGLGVGPDVRVGICVEREPELVVAVFGVLKAGGAYLPLDPGYPRERLLDMVQDSAPVVMLTQGSLAGRLAGLDLPLLALDEDAAWWEGQPDTDPERAALTPEQPDVRDLHLGLHGPSQGGGDDAPGRVQPAALVPGLHRDHGARRGPGRHLLQLPPDAAQPAGPAVRGRPGAPGARAVRAGQDRRADRRVGHHHDEPHADGLPGAGRGGRGTGDRRAADRGLRRGAAVSAAAGAGAGAPSRVPEPVRLHGGDRDHGPPLRPGGPVELLQPLHAAGPPDRQRPDLRPGREPESRCRWG